MYCDCQADEAILPEWAAVAQKAGDRPALKRINSRMQLIPISCTGESTTSAIDLGFICSGAVAQDVFVHVRDSRSVP
jgi:hypothetical protein